MDLDIPDSDEEVDEDEEDDEEDFKTKSISSFYFPLTFPVMLKRFGAEDDDDDDDEQVDDQDIDSMYDNKWGRGKKSYYSTDVKSDNKVISSFHNYQSCSKN